MSECASLSVLAPAIAHRLRTLTGDGGNELTHSPHAEATETFKYDIALSFAGEDRAYVGRVARILKGRGIRVFYDEFEQAQLWGRNLSEHLTDVYQKQAKYVIIFRSSHYAGKAWTNIEWRAAQARALNDKRDYILPARFDQSEIPGLPDNVAYVDLLHTHSDKFCDIVEERLHIEIPVQERFANVVDVPVGTQPKVDDFVYEQRIEAISKLSITQIPFYGANIHNAISDALESVADITRSNRDTLSEFSYQMAAFTSDMLKSANRSKRNWGLLGILGKSDRIGWEARQKNRLRMDEVRLQIDRIADRVDAHLTEVRGDVPIMESLFKKISGDLQELDCCVVALDEFVLQRGNFVSAPIREEVSRRAKQLRQNAVIYRNLSNKYEADINIVFGVALSACMVFTSEIIPMCRIFQRDPKNKAIAYSICPRLREFVDSTERDAEKIRNITGNL